MKGLVLFDIDRTLVRGLKGHILAFSEAFRKVYGVDTTIEIIDYDGMTDQQIIIEVLKKNGLDEKTIKSRMNVCMGTMISAYNSLIRDEKITVLGGVHKLLEKLSEHNFLTGLITGNLESIARLKLEKAGIGYYFKFGGFGSDDASRANLVRLAIRRAKEQFGFGPDNRVFLFGDTPRDIKAGKEAGVTTIGVATGIYSGKQLEEAGADFVLENLEDTDRVLEILSLK